MTPDSARLKWCPFVRSNQPVSGVTQDVVSLPVDPTGSTVSSTISQNLNFYQSINKPIQSSLCVADDCMMWKEIRHPENGFDTYTGGPDGFCGIAGRG